MGAQKEISIVPYSRADFRVSTRTLHTLDTGAIAFRKVGFMISFTVVLQQAHTLATGSNCSVGKSTGCKGKTHSMQVCAHPPRSGIKRIL